MIVRKLLFFYLCFFIGSFALAQKKTDTTFVLPQAEVKAKKTLKEKGIIKTTIDENLIQESLNASLSDLLSKHSPVFIKTYGQGALATASFRGTAASHTQVEWNDMNINSPMLGQVDFSLIPVYFVDEVSLLHGGSSLQNGSGALGGSVQVNSKSLWDTTFRATFIQTIGSFNTYQSFIKLSSKIKKLFFDIRAHHEQSDNNFLFYNNSTGLWNYDQQKNAEYQKNGILLNTYLRYNDKNIVSLNVWGQISNRNLPPIMSYQGSGREEKQLDNELRISGKWKNYGDKYKSDLSIGFSKSKLDYYLANQTPFGLFLNFDSKSNIKSFYNKYKFEYTFTKKTLLTVLANYNYHLVTIFDNRELTGYDASRNELGSSLIVHHELFKRFSLYGLVRYDYIDDKLTPVMPSLGVEYQVLKKIPLIIKSNFTRNYHQPSLNDLYWLPGGNPILRPEQGYTGDFAIEYQFVKDSSISLKTGVSTYFSHINDWIIWRPGEFRYWQADNIKKVYARGIEYTISAKGTRKKLDWGVYANYTFTKTTNEEETVAGDNSVGKQLIYIPENKVNCMVELGFRKFVLNYSFAYTGERFTTSSNEPTRHTLPSYSLHDVLIGKKIVLFKKELELQLKISNLFNVDYQAILWRAMPQRNYRVMIKFQF